MFDDSSSDSTGNEEECLKELLGGISFEIEWEQEQEQEQEENTGDEDKLLPARVAAPSPLATRNNGSSPLGKTLTTKINYLNGSTTRTQQLGEETTVFQNAFSVTADGRSKPPDVQIIDMTEQHRGNGLVASKAISRGTVIYTERAFCAAQVNPSVASCQFCFRSLEPISKLSPDLPCPERWPVLPLEFPKVTEDNSDSNIIDKYGRIQCVKCKMLFCCKSCSNTFNHEYGSCCSNTRLCEKVNQSLKEHNNNSQAPLILLVSRLFVHVAQYYRRQESLQGHPIFDLCGGPVDINALELGTLDEACGNYSLRTIYEILSNVIKLSSEEAKILSLDLFHSLSSKAARNSFFIRTQSPFKAYYNSLLRHNYGNREAPNHQARMSQIAQALFGKPTLERTTDRWIDERVAPETASIFLHTARCNHSCQPNAQVRSQEFVDAHIDVVASEDIAAGEEILISYIGTGPGVGKKTTIQRRRELQAKYLFRCDCPLCVLGE